MKVGDSFARDFHLTREIQLGFIELFGDRNPLHVDGDFARGKGFASEVMHGNILGGFLSYFIGECLPIKNVIIHSEKIKFLNPVYRGERLELKAVVRDVFESVAVVELEFQFRNAQSDTVAKGLVSIGVLP
jgi:3-hydroxybutyryl-CoA dehydratase